MGSASEFVNLVYFPPVFGLKHNAIKEIEPFWKEEEEWKWHTQIQPRGDDFNRSVQVGEKKFQR